MPLYDYSCPCGERTEKFNPFSKRTKGAPKCPLCRTKMIPLFSAPKRDRLWEDGITLDHIADRPKHFKDRKTLRTYCDAHGLESSALL